MSLDTARCEEYWNMLEHVAIVGASLAGIRTAEALRRAGFEGHLTIIGAEAETPYDRPPLSKQFLVAGWEDEKLALVRGGVEEVGAELRLGVAAVAFDASTRTVTLADGREVSADAVVLATGTEARRLPFGRELQGVLELRNLLDARRLREAIKDAKRVVIVGAGFIGMEVAASCRQIGLEVAVVEPLEAPLIRGLGVRLGERVAKRHREEGVVFHLGTGVEGFEGDDRVTGVRLSNGKTISAEVVVVGVGAVPTTAWLEGAGLEIENGVLCDATGFTGLPGVFAVGDCARWENSYYPERPRFEHWTSAVEQSAVVARQILTGDAEPHASIPYVWTDQFELRIAIAGELRPGDVMHVGLGKIEEDRFLALFGREENGETAKLVAAVAFKRPRQLQAARRMIAEGVGFEAAIAELDPS